MRDFAFQPATLVVRPGTTVTWVNRDRVAHTVSARRGRWGTPDLAPGHRYSFTFRTKGRYPYHCAFHPAMSATVLVR